MGEAPGLKCAILNSRLGDCWKCMTLSLLLLAGSLSLIFATVSWGPVEGEAGGGNDLLLIASVLAAVCFALLSLAHLMALILRRSLWRTP